MVSKRWISKEAVLWNPGRVFHLLCLKAGNCCGYELECKHLEGGVAWAGNSGQGDELKPAAQRVQERVYRSVC
jgi:hypothetical protein